MQEAKDPIILVHGGAGFVARPLQAMAVEHVGVAAKRAHDALSQGGDAEAAAIEAVLHMERTPCFNAGVGACMNLDGQFETDAGIMRSRDLRVGAVASVPDLADPIMVAQAVMEHSRHSILAGQGAARFGKEHKVGTFSRDAMFTEKAQRRFDAALAGRMEKDGRADTVGAVVMDARGDFCVAGSTGGVLLKTPGRVGDTPIVGAGFYASPELGCAAATGVGEAIMSRMFCFALLERYRREGGSLQSLAEEACDSLRAETKAAVGVIAIGPDQSVALAHACRHMSWASVLGEKQSLQGLSRKRDEA